MNEAEMVELWREWEWQLPMRVFPHDAGLNVRAVINESVDQARFRWGARRALNSQGAPEVTATESYVAGYRAGQRLAARQK